VPLRRRIRVLAKSPRALDRPLSASRQGFLRSPGAFRLTRRFSAGMSDWLVRSDVLELASAFCQKASLQTAQPQYSKRHNLPSIFIFNLVDCEESAKPDI
jgi:small-conductance mechanosensitive channel